MAPNYSLRSIVFTGAVLVACGPGKPGSSDATGASSTTDDASGTGATTESTTSSATTGSPATKCTDAKTEAACKMTVESGLDPFIEAACRWAEVRVATFPEEDMCSLAVVGGVCELATSEEGGLGCYGFFRETEGGTVELVSFDCGSPLSDAWHSCWDLPMDSPGFLPCMCLNPDL